MKKEIMYSLGALGILLVSGVLYYALSPLWITVHLDEALPQSATQEEKTDVRVAQSPIVGTLGHFATGTASVIQVGTQKVLRYENFKTTNGPDLFVYVSSDKEATDFINLGELKATEGNVNYDIPDGVDLSRYPYALVWCKQFGVLFNYADISQTAVHDAAQMEKDEMKAVEKTEATALFANGCFWCVEHDLEKLDGVLQVVSGYAGGTTENPTYKNYYDDGHREVVQVTYNPQQVSYMQLVEHIIKHGDPTDADGSFYDRGLQYAPAIYFANDEEKKIAQHVIDAANSWQVFENPLPMRVEPVAPFYPAEEYHQDYAQKNPITYNYFRAGSGRSAFIENTWGDRASKFEVLPPTNAEVSKEINNVTQFNAMSWNSFVKPSEESLKATLTPLQYEVTQEEGTESPFQNEYDKNYEAGIYVDIVSGEPLYFSKDKYDSGTGWPSFIKPISDDVVTLKVDKGLFTSRTEVRSRHADSHVGHVFDDGPQDRGGKRYCMNSAALRFIAKADMEREGYGYLLSEV